MMDEIRGYCALLLSEDREKHSAAYVWLRKCRPFQPLVEKFRSHDLSLFDVAAALVPNSDRPFSDAAVTMLEELLAAEPVD